MKTEPAKEKRLHESTNFVGVIMILILGHNTLGEAGYITANLENTMIVLEDPRDRKRRGGNRNDFFVLTFCKRVSLVLGYDIDALHATF